MYIYRDPREGKNSEPIYVGKGWGKRAMQHWVSGCDHNPIFQAKLDKIRAANLVPLVTIINVSDESTALDIERGLVAIYGRLSKKTGTLCNLTNGGDGYAVGQLTDAHREKIASSMRKHVRTEAHKKSLSVALTGKSHSEETREKIRAHSQAKAADPAFRQRLSDALKGRKLPDDVAQQRAMQLRQLNQSPERRAAVSAQMKAAHAKRRAEKEHRLETA